MNRRDLLGGAARLAPLVLLAGTAAACGGGAGGAVAPVAIGATDSCARCGMMISDLREAAEIIGRRQVWKFDDLGEMFAYYREQHLTPDQVRAMFVHDYDTRAWLRASGAAYVISPRLQTPMDFDVAAFGGTDAASRFAQARSGVPRSFAALLAAPPYPSPSAERMQQ